MHSRRRPRPADRRSRRRPRAPRPWIPFRLLARALIGVLVPLLGVTWLVGSSNVTLQIDGRVEPVTTHARTVDELLDRMGVEYTEDDRLIPEASTPLRDGMVIELVHAREITLLVGGDEESVLVTALSVDEVIQQLRSRSDVGRRSVIRTSRLLPVRSGMTVEVLNPVPVTVVVNGTAREVVTDAPNVSGVLSRMDVELDGDDRVRPALTAPVEAGMRIVAQRVTVRRATREVAIPYATEERPTDDLEQGEQREVQAGVDGVAEVTERVTVVDGEEEARTEVDRAVIRAPRTRIVEVGTATSAEPQEASSSSEESSEPRSAEPAPAPQETSDGRTESGQASYYHHPDEGLTAAHRTLPFGTVVTVTNRANGASVQVTINDRGPFIEGRIIDLNEPAFERIASTSAGVIDVRISW